MAIGARLTAASDYLFRRLFKFLFRYDIFISYARRDGKGYALKLKEQLTRLDFSCFLDYEELPAGNSLNRTLKRAIKRSAALIVVGTEGALKSHYVELEVAEFAGTGRAIIPIDFQGTLATAPWPVVKERDLVWVDETKDALAKNVPSPAIADAVDKLFKYTRRNVRVRWQVIATAVLFVLGAAVSTLVIRQQVSAANVERRAAEDARGAARQEQGRAEAAAVRAREQEEIATANALKAQQKEQEANEQAEEARKQGEIAKRQTAEAQKQAALARAKAEEAKKSAEEARRQGGIAREQTAIAKQQTAEAEKQTELARAEAEKAEQRQRLANSRELAADSVAQLMSDTQASLTQSIRAFETAPTAEAEKSLRLALLEPRVLGVVEDYKGDGAGAALSPDGKLILTVTEGAEEVKGRVRVSRV